MHVKHPKQEYFCGENGQEEVEEHPGTSSMKALEKAKIPTPANFQ